MRRLSSALAMLVMLTTLAAAAHAQTTKPAGPAPEEAVTVELDVPWRSTPNIAHAPYAQQFGIERGQTPTFRVKDASRVCVWLYRPRIGVDIERYPIVQLKYRAKNLAAEFPNALRVTFSQGGDATNLLFGSADIQADGKEHTATKDLRELNASGALFSMAFFVFSGADGDASLNVLDLSFHAPEEAANEEYGAGPQFTVNVKGADDTPISGATVTVDSERRNFARSRETNAVGGVTIESLGNERSAHMLKVEKPGFVTSMVITGDLAEHTDIKLIPGVPYGGIAKDDSGNPLANARVDVVSDNSLSSQLGYLLVDDVLTDAAGKWATHLAYPADADQVQLSMTGSNGETVRPAAADFKLAALKTRETVASTSPSSKPTAAVAASKPVVPDLLTKVDGSTIVGTIASADAKAITVKPAKGDAVSTPIDELIDIQLRTTTQPSSNSKSPPAAVKRPPSPPAGAWRIDLAGDDVLFAKVVKWADRKLSVKTVSVEQPIELPVETVKEIWMGSTAKIAKAKALNVTADNQDVAYVGKENDVVFVAGVIDGIDGESLLFTFNDQQRRIAVDRLVGLVIGGQTVDPEVAKTHEFDFKQTLQMTSGEILSGRIEAIKGGNLELHATVAAVKVALEKIDRISIRNGRLVYLSDLTPSKVEQTPYFDRVLPLRVNKSLGGSPLSTQAGPTTRGVTMPSRSVVTYDIGGKFDEFKSTLGFQQPEGHDGRANVRVLADGKAVFENPDVRGDQPVVDLSLKIAGVKQLTLEVDFGQQQDVGDWVVFAEPKLLRENLE